MMVLENMYPSQHRRRGKRGGSKRKTFETPILDWLLSEPYPDHGHVTIKVKKNGHVKYRAVANDGYGKDILASGDWFVAEVAATMKMKFSFFKRYDLATDSVQINFTDMVLKVNDGILFSGRSAYATKMMGNCRKQLRWDHFNVPEVSDPENLFSSHFWFADNFHEMTLVKVFQSVY